METRNPKPPGDSGLFNTFLHPTEIAIVSPKKDRCYNTHWALKAKNVEMGSYRSYRMNSLRWRLSASHSESMLCADDLETSPNRTRNGPVFPRATPHRGDLKTEAAAQVEHLVVNCSSSAAPVGHSFGATCNNLIFVGGEGTT